MATDPRQPGAWEGITREERLVIAASSVGTVFEWYDFYLYGSLSTLIGRHFFSALDETSQFIFALIAFAIGFAVRAFGALVFGRVGDVVGRKHAFLATVVIMGGATFSVGLLPGYGTIGLWAPALLILLRVLQGLALGGEYGGAATYVAEHAPHGRRGIYTSWIQTTATIGLLLSLLVILALRRLLGAAFDDWGWRIPFLLSAVLLAGSAFIRLRLDESPVFQRMKAEGKSSTAPLTESFLRWENLKTVLLVLLGGTAGQAVVWYTGMFYPLFFLTQILRVDAQAANLMVAGSLLLATPFFIAFGALSDLVGRKPVVMVGCALAALTYRPIFRELTEAANPALAAARSLGPATLTADPRECSLQLNPLGTATFPSSCDVARGALSRLAVPHVDVAGHGTATIELGAGPTFSRIASYDASAADAPAQRRRFDAELRAAVAKVGYPARADMAAVDVTMVMFLMWLLGIYVALVYAPFAAWLVELFPARIRYTSMSLPYHVGNGWFGGFLPILSFAIATSTGDIYAGLWYPIGVSLMTVVLGSLFLPETKDRQIHHEA